MLRNFSCGGGGDAANGSSVRNAIVENRQTKRRHRMCEHPVAKSLEVDCVVEIVLGRRLGHDRFDPESIDWLALELSADALDLDLVPGPVVAVAERLFERVPIGAVEHHGLAVLEVQDTCRRDLAYRAGESRKRTGRRGKILGRSFTSADFR